MVSSALGASPAGSLRWAGLKPVPYLCVETGPYLCALTLREGDMWRCGCGEGKGGCWRIPLLVLAVVRRA